jgi:hypothetical protein
MNKRILNIIIVLLIVSAFFTIGCKKDNPPKVDYYQIKVDSIISPDTISIEQALTLEFYGIIGINGCHSFHKFEIAYDSSSIKISVIGQYVHYELCTENLPLLNGKELLIYKLPSGNTDIQINNPDGNDIHKIVFVK